MTPDPFEQGLSPNLYERKNIMLNLLIILVVCTLVYRIIFSNSKPKMVRIPHYENYIVESDGIITMSKKIDIRV